MAKKKPSQILSKIERRPVGRPTKYKSEYCDLLIKVMKKGFSFEAVAGHIGISKDTLYDWAKTIPEFSDAKRIGLQYSQLFWEKIAVDHLIENPKGDKINSSVWIFNMKNRFNWTDKKEIEMGDKTRKQFNVAYDVREDETNADEDEDENEGDET